MMFTLMMRVNLIILLTSLACILKCASGSTAPYSPLIIVPGLAGSRLYFRSPENAHPKLVWVNPVFIEWTRRMTEYLRLRYNTTSHTTYSPYGYQHVTRGWGRLYAIEKLSSCPFLAYTDYHWMIKKILYTKYYKRDVTLRSAPYDFRKAPNEMQQFFSKLKLLIEDTYFNTGNNRVVLLGHSLGSLYSLSFLKQMSTKWKKQYMRSFISVSGPLAGAVKSLLMETTGQSVVFFKSPLVFREFERTFPSTAFLLPRPEYFGNLTLVQTPDRKYSAESYHDLFEDMGQKDGYLMYEDVKDLVDGSESPTGVDEVYCFHGYGEKTIESYSLKSFDDKKPHKKYGEGDGTVNKVSLQLCKKWDNVHYRVIEGANHKNILHNHEFMKRLMIILANE